MVARHLINCRPVAASSRGLQSRPRKIVHASTSRTLARGMLRIRARHDRALDAPGHGPIRTPPSRSRQHRHASHKRAMHNRLKTGRSMNMRTDLFTEPSMCACISHSIHVTNTCQDHVRMRQHGPLPKIVTSCIRRRYCGSFDNHSSTHRSWDTC